MIGVYFSWNEKICLICLNSHPKPRPSHGDPLFFISLSYMIRNPSVIFNIFDGDDVIKFITTKLVASGYTVRETYNRYFRFIEVCWDLV